MDVYIELLLLPKFDNSSPFVTHDKEICHVITSLSSILPEEEYPMEPFQYDVYLLSRFDVSGFSVSRDI